MTWQAEADALVRRFAQRAAQWDQWPGDLEGTIESAPDLDQLDSSLDAAYSAGILPSELRWPSDFVDPGPDVGLDQTEPNATDGWGGGLAKAIGIERLHLRKRPDCITTPVVAALRYAAFGLRVFPCDENHQPYTTHGFKNASNDAAQITSWWCWRPDARIGFWPGPSDIAILDVDQKNGKDGLGSFARMDGCPILPPTPTVHTPSGGWHLFYRMPEKRISCTVNNPGIGLDWRGDGGYTILPSPRSGYRWNQWHYGNCTPVSVPAALMPREPARRERHIHRDEEVINPRALGGVLRSIRAANEGERNSILFWAANRFVDAVEKGEIGETDAKSLLRCAANELGLDDREIVATINSAFRRAR